MSLIGFKAKNHPQQMRFQGANDAVDDRATTPELFEWCAERWGPFSIDVAAAARNTKCVRYYDAATDGLAQSWAGERVWCNPPYSEIRPWVEKAWAEETASVTMLLPANRTEQTWWQDCVEPFRDRPTSRLTTHFRRGRDRFIKAGSDAVQPNERPPFGCVILHWSPA